MMEPEGKNGPEKLNDALARQLKDVALRMLKQAQHHLEKGKPGPRADGGEYEVDEPLRKQRRGLKHLGR